MYRIITWRFLCSLFLLFIFMKTAYSADKVVVVPIPSSSQTFTNDSSVCDTNKAGAIRWTGTVFEGCDGTYWCRLQMIAPVPTVFSASGEWMDRNLGASQVAVSQNDTSAYGDLYQWGRQRDGHEKRGSGTTTVLSSVDAPGHGDFIITSGSPDDWRNPQKDILWHGASGINNPCPSGFRLPTQLEWETEGASWSSQDSSGAFNSPLKLTTGGIRDYADGVIYYLTTYGHYWSSSVNGLSGGGFYFDAFNASLDGGFRAGGRSVRCIKD